MKKKFLTCLLALVCTWTAFGAFACGKKQEERAKDGVDGRGVLSMEINTEGELIVTFTDGTSLNAGKVSTTHTHTYSQNTLVRDEDFYHEYICEGCGEIVKEKHIYVLGGDNCIICKEEEDFDFLVDYKTGIVFVLNSEKTGYIVDRWGWGDTNVFSNREHWMIPAMFNGLPVLGIDSLCVVNIKTILISENIATIREGVFDRADVLTTVYYKGTETEWEQISIGTRNDKLLSATRYYYSENEPVGEGNYWRYVGGVPTPWA